MAEKIQLAVFGPVTMRPKFAALKKNLRDASDKTDYVYYAVLKDFGLKSSAEVLTEAKFKEVEAAMKKELVRLLSERINEELRKNA